MRKSFILSLIDSIYPPLIYSYMYLRLFRSIHPRFILPFIVQSVRLFILRTGILPSFHPIYPLVVTSPSLIEFIPSLQLNARSFVSASDLEQSSLQHEPRRLINLSTSSSSSSS